jgi:UDP-N-acetylglucosamine--N-acetylmuramyl-(pentapeptide) pyrophosphoryl-undecaprenol N-acetylglucosamine transferase
LYPALSLARALSGAPGDPGLCGPLAVPVAPGTPMRLDLDPASQPDRGHAVLLVTARTDAGDRVLADTDVPIATVESRPISRSSLRDAASGLFGNVRGVAQALPLVSRFKPDVIVGAGGYASVPVVAAAALLRSAGMLRGARIVIMNPDVAPGLANRSLSGMADEVWCAYEATAKHFRGRFVLTGTPVRPEFYSLPPPPDARKRLGLDPSRTTILVFGGSQGARSINVAVSAMVSRRRLPATWQVLHIAGERDHEWMSAERVTEPNDNRYVLLPYLAEMQLAFAAADLAVCRSGASTLAELTTTATPSILVPYPFASEDHQRKNAEALAGAGAATIVDDAELDPDALYWKLVEIVTDDRLASMRAAAATLARPRALHDMVERIVTGRIGFRPAMEPAAQRSADQKS